ncbi:hypothetical protein AMECASPLE_016130 [Ameca splendens]|uniref:Uncharacterized protein n=1 Tax=Ameca splendens TaxID=208324 RepID=A0ABV0ZNP4_9TELE
MCSRSPGRSCEGAEPHQYKGPSELITDWSVLFDDLDLISLFKGSVIRLSLKLKVLDKSKRSCLINSLSKCLDDELLLPVRVDYWEVHQHISSVSRLMDQ